MHGPCSAGDRRFGRMRICGCLYGKSQSKDPAVWFILCFLTGIIGIVVLALSSSSAKNEESEELTRIPSFAG